MFDKKFGIIHFLLIIILSFSVVATWESLGSDSSKDYTTNDVANYNTANYSITSLNEYDNSRFEVLAGDLDGDGLAEILTYNNSQISIHDSDYNILGTYNSANINISSRGAWVITDFITGDNDEVVLFTTKADSSHSLYIMNWNSTDLILTKEITNLIENSGGIVCDELDNVTGIDCMYPATNSFIYRFNNDDTSINTPVGEYATPCHTSNVGYKGSEIYIYDIDVSGNNDFFITEYDSVKGECGDLSRYMYDIAGNNFTDEFSYSTTGYSITALTMVDLPDNANHGVAYAMSRMCSRIGTSPCCFGGSISEMRVVDVNTDIDVGGYSWAEGKSTHPDNWASGGLTCGASTRSCTPYIASLHSCFDDDSGNCDLYSPSDNIFAVAIGKDNVCTNFGTYGEMFVLNVSSATFEVLDNYPLGNTTPYCQIGFGEVQHSAQLPKAIWGDFTADGELEVMYNEIFTKTGEFVGKVDTTSTTTYPNCRDAYFSINELTGDSSSEVILKDMQVGDEKINIVSFGDYGEEEVLPEDLIYPSISCEYPSIFCDDFNYNIPLASKDDNIWSVYNFDTTQDLFYSPDLLRLRFDNLTTSKSANHLISAFPVTYTQSSSETVKESELSPVFSVEFTIFPKSNNFTYFVNDRNSYIPYLIKGVPNNDTPTSLDLLYFNQSNAFSVICQACILYNFSTKVKINSFYVDSDTSHYNASFSSSHIDVYLTDAVGGVSGFTEIPMFENNSENQKAHVFFKGVNDWYEIDDYYVMVGTDKTTANVDNYFNDLFIVEVTNATELGTGDGDLISSVNDFWYNNGLRSKSSRYFAGLILLFIVGLAVTGVMVQAKVHPNPLVIGGIMLLFMVFEVFIQLLPAWIPLILAILGAGAGALLWKFAST